MPASYFPDWDSFDIASRPGDAPVAFCGDLSPGSVLSAYKRGIIPFPAPDEHVRDITEFRYEDEVTAGLIGLVGNLDDDPYSVAWWSPDPRPVLAAGDAHLGRNVRKQLRRGAEWTTADRSFQRVVEKCRAGREPRWLTDALLESMIELHREGWAHSIEVWLDSDLIGGAVGIGIGRTLSGDSVFGRDSNVARTAIADMAARFRQAGGLLIDAQWDSPFLRSLGAEPKPRDFYLRVLASATGRGALPAQPLPARRLIEPQHPSPGG